MTSKKAFFDTAIFIYALEKGSVDARNLFEDAIRNGPVGTSSVTMMEYCTGCYKHGKTGMIERFHAFLKSLSFEIRAVDEDVAMEAARIRGDYPSFKAMDALQIASAVMAGADTFYTNDKQLLQFQRIGFQVAQMPSGTAESES